MSSISGYDSNSISTLFSSLNARNNSMPLQSLSGFDFATYSTIQNGSYKKLLNHYYNENSTSKLNVDKTDSDNKEDQVTSQSYKQNASRVKNAAQNLVDSLNSLDSYELWKKKSIDKEDSSTDNTGSKYDKQAIYDTVKSFVDDYNSLLSAGQKSGDTSVLRSTANIVKNTAANKKLLDEIGITINSDNKLSIDKTKFENADMTTVQSLFKGNSSFGHTVAAKASSIKNAAASQLSKLSASGMYSENGSYSYYNGSDYNTYL